MRPNQIIKLLLLLYVTLLGTTLSSAQNVSIDSLLNTVNPANPDTVNGQIYYELARKYYASDTKNALQWAKLGTKYFGKTEYSHLMTRCMNIEAVCLFILDRHEESIKLHYKILKIREEQKDTLGLAETFLNIGNVYYRGQDLEQSVKFYLKSREYALKKDNVKLLASLNNNIGNYYKDKFVASNGTSLLYKTQAIKHLKEAIHYKERLHLDLNISNTYTTLARIYYTAKEYILALKFAQKAEKISLQNKNDEAVASSKLLLCEIAIAQNEQERAVNILDGLYSYIGQQKAFHVLNMFDEEMVIQRNKIRHLKSNTSQSIDSLNDNNYNDLLIARQNLRENLQVKYETEKKELENKNLTLQNNIAAEKIERITIICIISACFILTLLFLIIKLIKMNKILLESKESLKKQAQLLFNQNALLKKSEEFKAKLFSIISHDLRSPLNSLKMIVQSSTDKQLSIEEHTYLLKSMSKELDLTSNLLNDLLFWSKSQMQAEATQWENFNLNNTVIKCIDTLSPHIELKQIQILNLISQDFEVHGDRMRCEFIVRNILHNAVKYSDCFQKIEIGTKCNTSHWDFYIKDHGVGMLKEQMEKIFIHNKSRKSMKGTRDELGAGIGLLLCHDFAESLGWSLAVDSEIGKGTTFHIYIKKTENLERQNTNSLTSKKEFHLN